MAQEALKKLEDQLNCSICLDTYTDPKQLQCHHVYCQKCLVRLVVRDQQGQLILTCPNCRQVTPVPANGVAGLQSAFNLIPILEIQDSFKKIKESPATLEGAVVNTTGITPLKGNCFVHGKELEVYCETCGELICWRCIARGGKHHDHDYDELNELYIKVEGQHIRGSPFSVVAKSPVDKLGSPILTIGGVRKPYGVTLNQRGEVVVTERNGYCVSMFSPSGEKLRQFGTKGSGHGQLGDPCGVAVDGEGNILVADKNNHRIQKFTADGQFLKAVGTEGSGPQQFNNPNGITFNSSNKKVYVADITNSRVQVLNSNLTFSSSFGKRGSGKGEFYYPWDITCDSNGTVYVADTCNHRIQVFTAEGKFLRMFGRHGKGNGELDWPGGVAMDISGLVYVSEWDNNRVSVFTSEGQFVTSFGRKGVKPGEFKGVAQLTVDNSGVVFVCDRENNRVQLF